MNNLKYFIVKNKLWKLSVLLFIEIISHENAKKCLQKCILIFTYLQKTVGPPASPPDIIEWDGRTWIKGLGTKNC